MSLSIRRSNLLSGMPEGIVSLFFIQIVSTLSFSVLYSTLVLYMKGSLHMSAVSANSIMGVFIAFNYALHLLGGFFGGRLLSNRALFCIGMMAQVTGCIFLSIGSVSCLYYGLMTFLTGSGLNVTCLNCMLTQRFKPDDTRRETAFLWNYAGMNIGFFVGFSMSGYFQMTQNYHTLFLLSSLGNFVALVLCMLSWSKLADKNTLFAEKSVSLQRYSTAFGLMLVVIMPFFLAPLLHYAQIASQLVIATGVVMMVYILYLAQKETDGSSRKKMHAFSVLMVVSAVFWMLYQISPMGLTLFIEHNVQRNYGDLVIQPQWFQNINTICIVFGGPLLSLFLVRMRHQGISINIPGQFAMALLCIGSGFILLPLGIHYADMLGMVSPLWIVLSYVLQSIGELLISPIGYAMIGSLAPVRLQGVMMGMWMLNTGIGATLSSYSSNLMVSNHEALSPLTTNPSFSHVFLVLGVVAVGTGVILFGLKPIINGWMCSKNNYMGDSESVIPVRVCDQSVCSTQ